jgi:hypothetical protein
MANSNQPPKDTPNQTPKDLSLKPPRDFSKQPQTIKVFLDGEILPIIENANPFALGHFSRVAGEELTRQVDNYGMWFSIILPAHCNKAAASQVVARISTAFPSSTDPNNPVSISREKLSFCPSADFTENMELLSVLYTLQADKVFWEDLDNALRDLFLAREMTMQELEVLDTHFEAWLSFKLNEVPSIFNYVAEGYAKRYLDARRMDKERLVSMMSLFPTLTIAMNKAIKYLAAQAASEKEEKGKDEEEQNKGEGRGKVTRTQPELRKLVLQNEAMKWDVQQNGWLD